MRFFNTAGPVNPAIHYCLPPLERLDLQDVLLLIAQQKYFVLHAPRQTGKTTCLLALMSHLNATDQYRCVYANVEVGQSAREDVRRGIRAVMSAIAAGARDFARDDLPSQIWLDTLKRQGEDRALEELLTVWAERSPLPLVLLIDEIDALVGDTLIAVLRQLRAGYAKRPRSFPQSVILCGVWDVRNYRIHSNQEKAIITGGSAFNIKAESLRLGNFNREEMESLYRRHVDETGQTFTVEALDRLWELTQGQPWLVNALGYETCFEMKANRDRQRPITLGIVDEAKENLILRRETHLDQLADKLKEERVRRVIEPLLAGVEEPRNVPLDDIDYVRDLGLIATDKPVRIANPIYREVIPRQLTASTEEMTVQETVWYVAPDARLDMAKLLTTFQQFFQEHSEHWVERFDYKEAGPQLLLQAFLQRIVNGGGRIEREYGLGKMRTDLLVIWPLPASPSPQKIVLELKVLHKSLNQTLAAGLEQTWAYLDRCGAGEGHLVIFDRTPGKPWEDKLFTRREMVKGRTITVWGM
ncbi:MAG: AAA family ATPase [Candidatus Contendobacter sp.]|nr:AAA family ATPase [Candidatus Contendobacter sp.]